MKKLIMIIIMTSLIACQKDDQTNNNVKVNSIAEIAWPKYGGDLRNMNRCASIRPMDVYPGPQLGQVAWQVDMGPVYTSPTIDSTGIIFVGSETSGKFSAVSAGGSVAWNGPAKNYWGDIAIGLNGNIFVCGSDSLYAISHSGSVIWRYGEVPQRYFNPVVGSEGVIYAASSLYMNAFNSDGSLKWKFSAPCGDYTGAIICHDKVFFNGVDGVYQITSTGTLIWKYDAQIPERIVIDAGGNIYFHSRMGTWLECLDKNGHLKWQVDYTTFEDRVIDTHSSPALDKDGRIVTAFNKYLHAFEPQGDLAWTFTLPRPVGISSPVIDSEGNIYICTYHNSPSVTDSSYIYKISHEGEEIWHLGIPGYDFDTTPAIGPDGRMYVGTNADNKGYLLAIE